MPSKDDYKKQLLENFPLFSLMETFQTCHIVIPKMRTFKKKLWQTDQHTDRPTDRHTFLVHREDTLIKALLVWWKDVYKKSIWEILVYSGKKSIKKTVGQFSSILPSWKLLDFQDFFFFYQQRVRRLFKKNIKSLIYFFKKVLLVQWKDVYKKKLGKKNNIIY